MIRVTVGENHPANVFDASANDLLICHKISLVAWTEPDPSPSWASVRGRCVGQLRHAHTPVPHIFSVAFPQNRYDPSHRGSKPARERLRCFGPWPSTGQ